jgi:hypothetical protein
MKALSRIEGEGHDHFLRTENQLSQHFTLFSAILHALAVI